MSEPRKFRKRPVVVTAEQFVLDSRATPEGVVYKEKDDWLGTGWFIKTLEGWMTVIDGDWVVTGVKGEKYPVKPDIFAATYEEVP